MVACHDEIKRFNQIILEPTSSNIAPQILGRHRAAGQHLEFKFKWFRGRFQISCFKCFFNLSLNSSWHPCLKFGTEAAWRERWSGVCRPGVESCQNPMSNSPERLQGVRRARADGRGSYRPERCSINFSTSVGHLRPFLAFLVPSCCQEVPNWPPRSPKRAQLTAKIAQESPTYGQDRPKYS